MLSEHATLLLGIISVMRITKNNIDKIFQALLHFLHAQELLLSWDGVFCIKASNATYFLDSDNTQSRPAISNKLYRKFKYRNDTKLRPIDVVAKDIGIDEYVIKHDIINVLKRHKNIFGECSQIHKAVPYYLRFGSLPSIDELMINYDIRVE